MAVEIPVYVDIEKAFNDAANRVGTAMKPMQRAVDERTLEVLVQVDKKGNLAEVLDFVGKTSRSMSELKYAIKSVEEQLQQLYSKNSENFDITQGEAKALSEAHIILTDILNQRKGISQELRKSSQEMTRQQEAINEHNAALQVAANSIDGLNAKLAAWRQELGQAEVGSPAFRAAAQTAGELARRLEEVNAQARILGTNTGSIEQLNAKLQEINRQYNALSSSDRRGAQGAKLLNDYRQVSRELQKEGQSLQQIIQLEQRRAEESQKAAQKRQQEKAILNSTVKSLDVLQEKERILMSQLSATEVGTAKFDQLRAKLQAVRAEIDGINQSIRPIKPAVDRTSDSLKNQSGIFMQLKSLAGMYLSVFGGLRFLQNIRETTAEFELQRVALGAIIQDTERAESLFRQIKAAAIESPFEIKDLVRYTKQLSAYQIETDKLFETTKKLADVSAGLGVDMDRLILAYGQVRAAAVLRGQELRQFTEAGIPLVDKLAEKFTELRGETVKTGEVFQLISERAVSFSMIEEIFDEMTSAGGLFYNMQEKQAETLSGQWANLKDSVSIMYDEIGNTSTVHNAMTSLIRDAKSIMLAWRQWWGVIKIVGGSILSYNMTIKAVTAYTKIMTKAKAEDLVVESARELKIRKVAQAIMGQATAQKFSTAMTNLGVVATTRAAAATNILSAAFWRLTAALAANPFGALALAVSGALLLFEQLTTKTRDVTKDIENMSSSINELDKTRTTRADMIRDYEELASKTNLSAKETARLKDTSEALAKAFPKTVKGINQQTGALILDIAKLKEYNAVAERAVTKGIQAQINVDEKTVEKNKKRINKLQKEINSGWGNIGIGKGKWSLFSPIYAPLSEEEIAKLTQRMVELQDQNDQLTQSIKEGRDAIAGTNAAAASAANSLSEWQNKISEFKYQNSLGSLIPAVDPEQLKNYTSLDEALEDIAKRYKEYGEQVVLLTAALVGKEGAERAELQTSLDLATRRRDVMKDILDYYNAFYLTINKSSGNGSYTQDPFIKQMEERMKFMKDFQKGYENLEKYLSSGDALSKEASIMLGRGQSLGIGPDEQRRAANDLSRWYSDMIEMVKERMKQRGAHGVTVTDLLSMNVSESNKAMKDLQSLLQSLWDAKTDFDTSQMQKSFEDTLNKLADNVKRSEAARDFYKNILELTGDDDLAQSLSVSVYGDIGQDFKDRVQEQLNEAFETFDASDINLWNEVRDAVQAQDFKVILSNLQRFPEEWQKVLKQLAEDSAKYNADIMQDFAKLVEKFGTTEEKIATIQAKAQQEIMRTISAAIEASESAATEEQADAILARASSIVKALEAQMDLDVFKQTDEYINFFSEINTMTAEQAALVRGQVRAAYIKAFQDGAISASQLAKELRAIDTQFKKLSEHSSLLGSYLSGGVEKAIEKLQEYADTIQILGSKISSGKSLNEGEQNFVTNMLGAFGGKFGGDSLKGIESFQDLISTFSQNGKGVQAAGEAFSQMGEGMSAMAAEGGGALAIVDMIVKAVNQTIVAIQSVIDELNKMRAADKQIAGWFRYVSDFNKYAYSGWENLKSGNLAGVAADVINSIVSIFNNVQLGKVNRLNKKIEEQQDILADLEYSYGRVEAAMAKAFGNDYVESYNRQLDNLLAQQEAYLRQAELERKKGKSSDKEKIKEYEDAARSTADQIADMQSQLSEFFAGTDLTSAATEFAQAWIEAYKQFGSTTDAMKEKFQDMIENMITNSLAAKLMQSILQPLFDEIDQMALSGNELSASEIGQIAAEAPDYINRINNAMTTLMNQMAAAGYNVRQQAGSFTGISRSIAGASEESINGLAAGINTQNFYISYVPTISANVAAILSVLGGSPASPNAVPNAEEGPSYEDQMLMYTAYLPQMHDDMAAVRQMLERVIKPLGVSATHYVAIR